MEYNPSELDVVFFRHKFRGNIPKEDVEQLWEDHQVALHWSYDESTDPSDYNNSTAQNEIRRLNEYAEKGVIVAAYYGNDYDIHSDEMLVGVVPPGTNPVGNEETGFKTLQMDNDSIVEVSFKNYPVLSAVRPRGGSLCHWYAADDQVRTILKKEKLPAEVGSLSPSQLEVACNEFLRVKFDGYFPTLPVGRTLRDVDIVGGTQTKRILAQVTQSSSSDKVESKLNSLQQYTANNTHLILFGSSDSEPNSLDAVDYITVEEVFDTLYTDGQQGRQMLDRMLNPA